VEAAAVTREEALEVVIEAAFEWAQEYGFNDSAAALRVWEAAALLRADLEPGGGE